MINDAIERHTSARLLEAERKRFSDVHKDGDRGATLPPPMMEFGGVLNNEQDIRIANIIWNFTPRPKVDPRNN